MPPVLATASPLAGTYRRLTRSCDALDVRVPAAGGQPLDTIAGSWLNAREVATRTDALDALVDGESARILAAHGHTARPDAAASRVLHHYLWQASLLISGPWYLERKVPRIGPEDLWIQPATGALALTPGDFSHAADDDASRAELRSAVADHVQPLLAAFGPRLRRGPRALWGMAADDLVSGIWYLGRVLGQEEHAVREAAALLPGGTPPFPGAAGFRRLRDEAGRSHVTRTRAGCCMYYTIRPAEACLTCPRTSDAERLRRF
jgi:hypothetical protein